MQIFDELLAEIDSIPIIDISANMRPDAPAANLSDIALSGEIQTELRAIGVSSEILENPNRQKALTEITIHLPKISNTTASWCLSQILHDLYAQSNPIDNGNLDDLWAKVEKTAADSNWPTTVLDRANVSKVLINCDWNRKLPSVSDRFAPILRLDSLINDSHLSKTLDKLGEVTEQPVYEVADLKKAITNLFRRAREAGAVAVAASFEPMTDFEPGSRDAADRIISMALLGQKANREDRKAIRSYVIDLVLAECAEHAIPFQLMLGIRRKPNEEPISAFEPTMLSMYTGLFSRHSQVKFDVFTANETLAHELAVISRNYRNVYLSGYWMYLMFPTHIRKLIRERVEMLPMTKSCGFFSDAASGEWVYGKSKLIRRELAFALTQMISEGYITRETALSVARYYLYENPKRIYRI